MGSVCRFIALAGVVTLAGVARAQTAVVVSRPPVPVEQANTEKPLAGTPMAWTKNGPARVVWTGFQMHGDGSRVYLQATADVEVSVAPSKGGLTVTVHNCRLQVRNARRPMDTRFFRTPVKSVALSQQKKDVALHIALGESVGDVVARKEDGPNGSQFWVLDFPAPQAMLAEGQRPALAH